MGWRTRAAYVLPCLKGILFFPEQYWVIVYMLDKCHSLKVIAEYGQEYGKENPIYVLYHSYGHHDALQNPSGGPMSW
ncbi:hypothetical protein RJ641_005203 [Dillenia turbinata]|uniref:OTU domain-containing protein n=1 Tax=Dillenia turbinata TaxID=194707 RepID=A0AAN8ZCU9_9MAGN